MRTINDLTDLLNKCKSDLASIGIVYGNNINLNVELYSYDVYGDTSYSGEKTIDTEFTITIDPIYQDERVSVSEVKGILYHELLHTVPDSYGHDLVWKENAKKVKINFPGCPLGCEADMPTFYNVSDKVFQEIRYKGKAKYVTHCKRCGMPVFRTRMADFVKHPENYECACGGQFEEFARL